MGVVVEATEASTAAAHEYLITRAASVTIFPALAPGFAPSSFPLSFATTNPPRRRLDEFAAACDRVSRERL